MSSAKDPNPLSGNDYDADALWQEMRTTGWLAGKAVILLESVASTNTVALEMAREGAAGGTVVVAETQSQGRGRLGRVWDSPPGCGLYFSVILRPALLPRDFPKITLTAGLAVSQGIEAATGLQTRLKWPNDLLLAGRKVGGILAENSGWPYAGTPFVILGIGLNIKRPPVGFPAELCAKAISLQEFSGRCFSRSAILHAILLQLDRLLSSLEQGEFAAILSAWRQRDAITGPLAWLTPAGEIVTGISLGPDEEGILHIRDEAGRVHEVVSGDISLLG